MNSGWFPLSAAQNSRWFSYQLDPSAQGGHNNAFALRVQGGLDPGFLKKVVASLLKRHPMLRVKIRSYEGVTEQSVAGDVMSPVHVFDLRDADRSCIEQRIQSESVRAFDLSDAPLMRVNLFVVDNEDAVLQLVLDHIICDGWSYWILLDELTESLGLFDYEIDLDDEHTDGPTYLDYVQWQRDWFDSQDAMKQLAYWQGQLAHDLPILQLNTDRQTPPTSRHQQDIVSLQLDERLTDQLQELVRQQSSTLFVVLLAAYQMLLHRHTGQHEILVGTAMPARNRQEWESLVGDFVNTIAIGANFDNDPSAVSVLRAVRSAALNGMSNQDFPFSLLVEKLKLSGTAHHPVFQTMFVLQKARHGTEVLALWDGAGKHRSLWRGDFELTAYPVHHSGGTAGFALSLEAIQFEKNIRCEFKYDPEVFDRSTIDVLAGHYRNLLQSIVNDPALPVSQLSLLDDVEYQKLHPEDSKRALPNEGEHEALIHPRFEAMARQHADAIALTFADQQMTYGELNARANQCAHYLVAKGVRPEDRVAIFMERGFELIVGVLGILKAGAAYVPIDPSYPCEHIRHVLQDSAPKLLMTQSTLLSRVADHTVPTLLVDQPAQMTDIGQQPRHNIDPQSLELGSHNLAYIIYTSGSTGLPKGVMIEHRHVTRLFAVTHHRFNFNANDVWTLFHSIAFDFSVWELWGALFFGGRLVVVPVSCARSTDDFYALLCEQNVTVLNQTPSAFRQLITAQGYSEQRHSLRYVIFGGEALELHTLMPWFNQNTGVATRLINMYGITEITVHATYREITLDDVNACRGSVIGEPLDDLALYILDPHGQVSPFDIAGEIYIGGSGVARGYWNRPALTAERFIEHPQYSRLYKTGDLARRTSTNEIIYMGRNDFQVKIRGFRIELGEIEAKLAACNGVREAAVIAREDIPGDKRLVAYLVMMPGQDFSVPELRKALSNVLPPHMIPSAFVCLSALPLTPNGKLDRKALPEPGRESVARRPFEAPKGAIEEAIAAAWKTVLKIETVGRNDHFFELGGHSLLVVSLMDCLRKQGIAVDVRTVFTTPVLHELAAALENRHTEAALGATASEPVMSQPGILPLGRLTPEDISAIESRESLENIQEIYPLSPLQQGILFHHLMNAANDFYVLRTLLSFASRKKLDDFLAALQKTVNKHDVLRSSIRWEGLSLPVQIVHKSVTLPVNVLEAPTAGEPGQALAWLGTQTDPALQKLDLTRAPLMTAYIVEDRATGEWLLALLHHHIISDHHTLKLVLGDVAKQLQGNGVHADSDVDVLPYRTYVAQALERSQLADEDYFKAQLRHVDSPTAPFEVYRVPASADAPNEQRYVFEGEIATMLRTSTRRQGVSPAVLFHLAWAKVLGLVCGRDEVVFGTVLSGRQSTPGAERMLGVFINTLPLRVPLTDFSLAGVPASDDSLASALKVTFMQLTGLLDHEMAPLALAQRCSGVAPSKPLFTSLLNYRHTQDESLVYENGLPQLKWEGINVIRDDERTHYPVTLSINDVGDSFVLTLQTVAGIDGPLLMRCMQQVVTNLVVALHRSPGQSLAGINLIADGDRQALLDRQDESGHGNANNPVSNLRDATQNDDRSPLVPGSVEQKLADIWSELLVVSGISRQSNFFDLGGHSLNMMQLASRIRITFGIAIPVSALFEMSTFQEMASMIKAMSDTSSVHDSTVDDEQETEEFSI